MRQNQIGNTGLQVTEFGFGAASLGNLYRVVDDDTTTGAVNTAWARGIRYFDTAPHYGLGLSERRLGAALGAHPRSEYVLSTKVGRLLEPNPEPSGSDLPSGGFAVPDTLRRRFDFRADGVRRSLDSSLERLGVDYVDLVLVHDPDSHVDQAIREAIPALIRLREQGVVRAIGVAMNQWQAPLRIVEETTIDAVMLAGRWTLLDRTGQPLLDACAERGVSVLAAAPYNSGLLSPAPPAQGCLLRLRASHCNSPGSGERAGRYLRTSWGDAAGCSPAVPVATPRRERSGSRDPHRRTGRVHHGAVGHPGV